MYVFLCDRCRRRVLAVTAFRAPTDRRWPWIPDTARIVWLCSVQGVRGTSSCACTTDLTPAPPGSRVTRPEDKPVVVQ